MGGGWALDIETFLGPANGIELIGECHLGPKKVELGFIRKVNTCFPQGGGGFEV
jgi:hypothetical protein